MRILLWLGSFSLVPLGAPSARPPAQASAQQPPAGRRCPPQDLRYTYWGNRRPCSYPALWYWNGQRCLADGPWGRGLCRRCEGADCARVFAAQADCERAFAGCASGPVASAPPTSIPR